MNNCAIIEAILYLEGEVMDEAALANTAGLKTSEVSKALEDLAVLYKKEDRGLELLRIGTSYMLSPKKEYWDALKERYGRKNEARLSKAALETLSIIAYSQPITRSEIEALRGVSADNMIRLLLEKGLIHEVGKKDVPGKPTQFGTTKEFLKQFHLASIAELPRLNESDAERFESNSST